MSQKKLTSLSIFLPAFNEAGNIEEAVLQSLSVAEQIAEKFEVLIINDGSKDATKLIGQRLAQQYPQVRIVSQKNTGYGGALKRGFKESKYDWIFFTDSDLQFDIAELKKFVPLTKEYTLLLGYRLQRAEGWKRRLFADLLKIWNRVMLGFPRRIKDIDCAFKLMHRTVLAEVGPLVSDGAMVSTELLLKVHRHRIALAQVGVSHYNRRTGNPTGNHWRVILRAVRDTFVLQRLLLLDSVTYIKREVFQLA